MSDNIDRVKVPNDIQKLMWTVRTFAEQQRQITIRFNPDGSSEISSPKIGNRNPAHPQPTPPQSNFMRKAA